MENKLHINEDYNSGGSYWGNKIERDDIRISNNIATVDNKCPFTPDVKRYIQDMVTDIVNIAIDEQDIRNIAKLNRITNELVKHLAKMENKKMPRLAKIDIIPIEGGLMAVIYAGVGYMVSFEWTLYNEHKDMVTDWYKRSAKKWIRDNIKDVIDKK